MEGEPKRKTLNDSKLIVFLLGEASMKIAYFVFLSRGEERKHSLLDIKRKSSSLYALQGRERAKRVGKVSTISKSKIGFLQEEKKEMHFDKGKSIL